MSVPWPLVIGVLLLVSAALIDTFVFVGAIGKAFDVSEDR